MSGEFAPLETASRVDLDSAVRRSAEPAHDHEGAAPTFGLGPALMVGSADDALEHEADDIASAVVQRLASAAAGPPADGASDSSGSGSAAGAGAPADDPRRGGGPVRRAVGSSDAPVVGAAGGSAGDEVSAAIAARRGGGSALPDAVRGRFEGAMGGDFSAVRIHTDSGAARISRAISARAFTVGNDIFFGSGVYAPGTAAGQHTLAHELAHTQQGGSAPVARTVRRDLEDMAQKMKRPLPPTPTGPGAAPARTKPPLPAGPPPEAATAAPAVAAQVAPPVPPRPVMGARSKPPLPSGPPPEAAPAAAGPAAVAPIAAGPPASPERLAQSRKRSRDLTSRVGMAAESIQARIAPQAALSKAAAAFDKTAESAADEVLQSTVKPVVLGAAVKKLVTKAKSMETDTFGDNIYEGYAKLVAGDLVQARLKELMAMEAEIAADPAQFAVSDQARVARARAALGSAGKPYRTPKVNKDMVVQASRRLITALVDAKMYAVVDSDTPLSEFAFRTKPQLRTAAAGALRGTGYLVPQITAEISAQISMWTAGMREQQAIALGSMGESEAEIDAAIASMNAMAGEASAFLAQIDTALPKLFDGHPKLEAVALQGATAAAGPLAVTAADELRAYMGSTAAVKKRMLELSSGADKAVLAELRTLSSNTVSADKIAMSDDGAAALERVRDEIKGSSEGATSKLATVGKLLDTLLDNNSKAGASTSLETVVRIPVPVAPGAFLGLRMKIEGTSTHATKSGAQERTVSVEMGVQAGGGLPLAGSVCAELGGYLRGSGRTAAEAMEFVSYALYRRFRESNGVPKSLTNAIWGLGGTTAMPKGSEKGDGSAAEFREAEAWGTGMEDRLRESGGSAETGAYGAVRAELGVDPVSGSAGAEAAASMSVGTKYSSSIVDNRRAQGAGAKVTSKYGGQESVGQARRNLTLSGSAAAAGFGASGLATLSFGLQSKPGAGASYGVENLDIRFSGIGRKPPTAPFADDQNTTLTIMNWAGSLLAAIRSLRGKMQAAKETTIDGEMTGANSGISKGKFAPTVYDINDKTGASEVAAGFIETIRDKAASGVGAAVDATSSGVSGLLPSSGGGGGGPLSDASDAVGGAASSAAEWTGGAAKVAEGGARAGQAAVTGGVAAAKKAVGFASDGGLHLTARYRLNKSGDSFDHILDISFGVQSKMSINVSGVRVVYASTNNLVTILLLPERKVLA